MSVLDNIIDSDYNFKSSSISIKMIIYYFSYT